MNKIKQYIAIVIIVLAAALPVAAAATPVTNFGLVDCSKLNYSAQYDCAPGTRPAVGRCSGNGILTFPTWYKNLQCTNGKPAITKATDLWLVALNVIEMMIGAAVYLSVGYVIWGGFKFIISRGDPGKAADARMTILQASIGLGIALASTAIVSFVGSLF